MSDTIVSARADGKPPMSSRNVEDKGIYSARNSARAEMKPETARSARGSAREGTPRSGRLDDDMDTFRSTMSTARVHTALAALTAEKNALEARLAKIDSSLETEKRKGIGKRGSAARK